MIIKQKFETHKNELAVKADTLIVKGKKLLNSKFCIYTSTVFSVCKDPPRRSNFSLCILRRTRTFPSVASNISPQTTLTPFALFEIAPIVLRELRSNHKYRPLSFTILRRPTATISRDSSSHRGNIVVC